MTKSNPELSTIGLYPNPEESTPERSGKLSKIGAALVVSSLVLFGGFDGVAGAQESEPTTTTTTVPESTTTTTTVPESTTTTTTVPESTTTTTTVPETSAPEPEPTDTSPPTTDKWNNTGDPIIVYDNGDGSCVWRGNGVDVIKPCSQDDTSTPTPTTESITPPTQPPQTIPPTPTPTPAPTPPSTAERGNPIDTGVEIETVGVIDEDSDGYRNKVKLATGKVVEMNDLADNSPGIGEEGIAQLEEEFLKRGFDVENMSKEERAKFEFVAKTVNPKDWHIFYEEIFGTRVTVVETTTTTEERQEIVLPVENDKEQDQDSDISSKSEVPATQSSVTTSTAENTDKTVNLAVNNSDVAKEVSLNNGNEKDKLADKINLALFAFGASVFAFAGGYKILAFLRRRKKNKDSEQDSKITGSPSSAVTAGN